jgi:Tol biopolymer transport system component
MLRSIFAAALVALVAAAAERSAPAAGPQPGRLAFASARAHGDLDIYVARADGADPVRVTSSRLDEFSPSWTPDGRRIAYRVNSPNSDEGDIWTWRRRGTESEI